MESSTIGIALLAAGASSRLGEPKQLLRFQDETLLRRAARTALQVENQKTVVVLGANASIIHDEIADLPVETIVNHDWQNGMSSSIKSGLRKLLEIEPELSAVVLMLCDQPFVTAQTLMNLVEKFAATKKSIVACEYEKMVGVPALFARAMFGELLDLKGEAGARFVIKKFAAADLAKIAQPEAAFDVDTIEDYRQLLTKPS